MKFNQIYDIYIVEDGSGSSSTYGLNSSFFGVTAGATSVTISSLIGGVITALFREGVPYELVTGTPGNREYNFNSTTGVVTFGSSYPFDSGERLFVIWEGSGTAQTVYEPVTVTEMKDYLRLEGFVLEDESTATVEFDDDDLLIKDMITAAREGLEDLTGWALVPKTLRVLLCNKAGMIQLPYPPFGDLTSLTNEDDDAVTDYELRGSSVKYLKEPLYDMLTATYTCGFSTPQAWVKDAIMKEVAYRYKNRGDENVDGLCKQVQAIAKRHAIKSWLV